MSKAKNFELMATADKIKDSVRFKNYAVKAEKSGYICPCCHSGDPNKAGGSDGTGAVTEGVEKNTWYCHKCGEGGDVLTYLSYQLGYGKKPKGKQFAELVEQACKRYGVEPCGKGAIPFEGYELPEDKMTGAQKYSYSLKEVTETSQTREKAPQGVASSSDVEVTTDDTETPLRPDFTGYLEKCAFMLKDSSEAVEYLKKRGISLDTAKKFGIGYDPNADPCNNAGEFIITKFSTPRVIIPSSRNHYVGRAINPNAPIQKANAKGSSPSLFGYFLLSALKDDDICYVTEGAFDAMSIIEAEPNAVAVGLNSVENGKLLIKEIERLKLTNKHFVIIPDNEQAEDKKATVTEKAEKLIGQIYQTGNYATCCNICSLCSADTKDTNDFLINDVEQFKSALITAKEEHFQKVEEMKQQQPQAQATPEAPVYSSVRYTEDIDADEEERILKAFGDFDNQDFNGFTDRVFGDTYEGFDTGIPWFDAMTAGGLLPSSLVVLLAPAGTGKTTLLQFISEHYADKGFPVRYINFEMPSDVLLAKSLSMRLISKDDPVALSPIQILKSKHLHPNQQAAVKAVYDEYKQKVRPFLHYSGCKALSNISDFAKYTRIIGARAKATGQSAPILIIDYLQILGGGTDDVKESIRLIMLILKNYAEENKTIAFIISATNRDSAKEGQISMESGRDSSNIEFSADYIFALNNWCVDCGIIKPNDMKTLSKMKKKERYRRMLLRQIKGRLSGADTDEAQLYFDGEHSIFYQAEELFDEYGFTDKFLKLKELYPVGNPLKLYRFDDSEAAQPSKDYEPQEVAVIGKSY